MEEGRKETALQYSLNFPFLENVEKKGQKGRRKGRNTFEYTLFFLLLFQAKKL